MPIRTRLHRTLPPNAAELTRMLFNEWTQPSEAGQPVIVVEGQKPDPIHIYIIWDEWRGMNQTDRSEIIMDVYDNVMVGLRDPKKVERFTFSTGGLDDYGDFMAFDEAGTTRFRLSTHPPTGLASVSLMDSKGTRTWTEGNLRRR